MHICTWVSVAAVHLQVGSKETGGGRGLLGRGGGGGGGGRRREGQGGGEGVGRFEVVIVGTSEVVARCGGGGEEHNNTAESCIAKGKGWAGDLRIRSSDSRGE